MPPRARDPYARSRPTPNGRQSYDSAYSSSRDQISRAPSASSMSSRSPSPRRSRDRPRRRRRYSSYSRSRSPSPRRHRRAEPAYEDVLMPMPEDKPWFKKKTLWATLASAATIVAVMPTWKSANASRSSAKGSHRSADAAERSADASLRSARAVERSTKAVERSANAVVNTAVASGHQDHHGRYLGPHPGDRRREREDDRGRDDWGRAPPRRKEIEYDPLQRILQSANVPAGLPVKGT
ncbi:hypothetical protein SMMN14_02829 [Sphaerulina musiva]